MSNESRTYYLIALVIGLLLHASILFFTFEKTYDAYVHMFFAEHYAENWFESWNFKWYEGFTITSYPPLVHQIIALLSFVIGLKGGFLLWSLIVVILLIRGVYHFSQIWVDEKSAGYAAILTVFSSSIAEALHVFGQLPSLTGIALLLNACPEVYQWFRFRLKFSFFSAITLLATTTTAHHVSTIFGMVFFVLPVIGVALMDRLEDKRINFTWTAFFLTCWNNLFRVASFGLLIILITLLAIFPYWYWSGTDPITQISIPHGSRDSFIANPSSGLVFFLIPWGMLIFAFSYIFQNLLFRRNLFIAIAILLAFILGTGGTTSIPILLLGENAFNILTLDRFTFWGSMLAMPFFGLFINQLFNGGLKERLCSSFGAWFQKSFVAIITLGLILFIAFTVNVSFFRPMQPSKIDVTPIVNFLERDGHSDWRYLTLGFGDQMAWLGANTRALTVDGNYHSARRLPELTSRAVERLENSKYLGTDGIEALKDFLVNPDKHYLKYVFSNDKFYEPLLHFSGWSRIQQLENNIELWERPDVSTLPAILPQQSIPNYQRLMWGILPLFCLLLCFMTQLIGRLYQLNILQNEANYFPIPQKRLSFHGIWFLFTSIFFIGVLFYAHHVNSKQNTIDHLITNYYHALDFKQFEAAYQYLDPNTRPTQEQYFLELSLEDGIMASYSKLMGLEYEINYQDKNNAKVLLNSKWLTSLNEYNQQTELDLVKRNSKWFVKHKPYELSTPPDQLVKVPELDIKQQGRRKADVRVTRQEDILDRPELFVDQANLILLNDQLSVVGHLTNVDNDPAYVTVEIVLYDGQGKEQERRTVGTKMIHNLFPKESTVFQADFDFDFDGSTEDLDYAVFVRSVVYDRFMYKYFGISDLRFESNKVFGEILNNGSREISIPHVLIPRYLSNRICFIDEFYLPHGIRSQRSKAFSFKGVDLNNLKIIKSATRSQLIVNGIPGHEAKSIIPEINILPKVYLNGYVPDKQ